EPFANQSFVGIRLPGGKIQRPRSWRPRWNRLSRGKPEMGIRPRIGLRKDSTAIPAGRKADSSSHQGDRRHLIALASARPARYAQQYSPGTNPGAVYVGAVHAPARLFCRYRLFPAALM